MESSVISAIILGVTGIVITGYFSYYSKKIANDKMMKDLFTEFNQRYDTINNILGEISELHPKGWDKLKATTKSNYHIVIIDFFNICAEEYYWYQEGRIDDKIWNSWFKGMNDIFNSSPAIQYLWDEECKKDGYKSYYINKPNEFFSSYKLGK